MRYLIAVTAAAMIATPAMADTMAHCGAAWKAMSAADQAKQGTYATYSKTCLAKGYTVPATASGEVTSPVAPAGSTGQCKDGSYTSSKTHSGACSRHGGVAKWM